MKKSALLILTLTFISICNAQADCEIIPEYRYQGEWVSGLTQLTVNEGEEVTFSILPNDLGVTVILPNGQRTNDNHAVIATPETVGTYILKADNCCETSIELSLIPPRPVYKEIALSLDFEIADSSDENLSVSEFIEKHDLQGDIDAMLPDIEGEITETVEIFVNDKKLEE